MTARAAGRRRLLVLTGALVALLAAWNNLVVPRLPGYPGSTAVLHPLAAVAVVAAGRWAELTWAELGLSRDRVPAGLRTGGIAFGLVAAGYAVLLAVPAAREQLAAPDLVGPVGGAVAYDALVRVPLATVLWEEVAFRGVLLGVLLRLAPARTAVLVSSELCALRPVARPGGPRLGGRRAPRRRRPADLRGHRRRRGPAGLAAAALREPAGAGAAPPRGQLAGDGRRVRRSPARLSGLTAPG